MSQEAVAETKVMYGPWELPEGWKWVKLKDVARSQADPAKPSNGSKKLIRYLGLEDVQKGQWEDIEPRLIAAHEIKSTCITFTPSHILYAKLRPYLNKVVVPSDNGFGSTEWVPLRIEPAQLDRNYLAWYLRSPWFVGYASSRSNTSGARMPRIRMEALWSAPVPIPSQQELTRSLDTQHRIVARIEALMMEAKKARTLLEQMRRDADLLIDAALKEVVDHLPLTRKPLIDVIESKPRNGWSPKCDDKPNGIPVLKLGAVLWFRYNPSEVKRTSQPVNRDAHYWLQPGDVLISRSNTPELVGHASIYTGTPFPCIYPDLLMRFRVRESEANSNFLIYWLRTREVREYINRRASGASPTMKKIKQDDVCNLPFPTIDVERQLHWVAYLDSIQSDVDELMRLLEQDAKLLDQLEQSILERAFRGEL